jgi:hypothetical protein
MKAGFKRNKLISQTPHSPDHTLQKAVTEILANCGQSVQQAKGVEPVKQVDEKQVALLLSRA